MATPHGAVASAVEKLGVLLAQQLGHLLVEEIKFLSAVRDDVDWMRSQLRWMESFLKDADANGRKGDERTKTWVREVREVAYQAEDVVDIFMWRIERRRGATKEFFRRYACIPSKLVNLHDIGNQILLIKSKIHSIRESKDTYGIVNLGENKAESSGGLVDERLQIWRKSSPRLGDDAIIVGFDVQKKSIMDRLLDANLARRCVISIVGLGGIGKTTLATRVYNGSELKSHFNARGWITVSQNYTGRKLIKDIMRSVRYLKTDRYLKIKKQKKKLNTEELKSELYNFLQPIRYLIVLDDIWEQDVWLQIRDAFPNAMNGSRLLMTTRFMNVAKSADPRISPLELPFLSDVESLELFVKVVFPSDQGVTPTCPKELEELGQDVVKKCSGLPLAVVVLGGLFSITDPTVNAWQAMADNMDWESTKGGKECLQILALSYDYLPDHNLKSCFLYLGCFPEDFQMKASEVIKLWIAEGFVLSKKNQTLEETARGYLDELVQRCMVQVVNRSETTRRVKSFSIHDLFRDWCISEGKEDGFLRICNNYNDSIDHNIVSSRHLALSDNILGDEFPYLEYKARAILGFNLLSAKKTFINSIVHGFKFLRVIYLRFPAGFRIYKSRLPKEISSLIHLRSITLRSLHLSHLPSSIGKLHNLQILDITGTSMRTLPKTLHNIQVLRHIKAGPLPVRVDSSSIGKLRNLQTLKYVGAGSWIQRDLSKLSSIRKLAISHITGCHEVSAISDSIPKLDQLSSLYLGAYGLLSAASLFTSSPSHQHLYKLTLISWSTIHQFPQSLINLSLEDCQLDQDGIAALESLPSLAILNLEKSSLSAGYDEMAFSGGGFSKLQKLQLQNLRGLKSWRIERGAMPNLTYLNIRNCNALGMQLDELEHLASLQELVIDGVIRSQKSSA